jgi:predicted site-specific integrase-resolvase
MGPVRIGVGTEWLLDGRAWRVVRQPAPDRYVAQDTKFLVEQEFSQEEILNHYSAGRLRFASAEADATDRKPAQETRHTIQDLEELIEGLKDSVDCRQAAKELGIFHKIVWSLIQEGLIERAVRTGQGWRIPRRSLESFVSSFRQLPRGTAHSPEWLSFREAVRSFGSSGMTVVRLIRAIRDGSIEAQWDDRYPNLCGLVVDHQHLATAIDQAKADRRERGGYPLTELGPVLFPERPMARQTLDKWIRAGLLRVRKEGRNRLVETAEINRFRTTYCLCLEACRSLDISRSTLGHWEAAGKLRPVYGRRGRIAGGFSLYLRADVERLLETIDRKPDKGARSSRPAAA